ncbi:unnamed protein product [Porites lobata]|uniref:Alpha-type protein kinase domain-containing protein n=1 Tax=Porites lobata TaxID=104759 RepID=A0ABN8QQX1_9CNID|nr:unnamed protein product [Porites lobata]
MGQPSVTREYTWEESIESEYIDGEFTKYLNNTGKPCDIDSDIWKKCESLAHLSYERSSGNLMVVDMQGSGHTLFTLFTSLLS